VVKKRGLVYNAEKLRFLSNSFHTPEPATTAQFISDSRFEAETVGCSMI